MKTRGEETRQKWKRAVAHKLSCHYMNWKATISAGKQVLSDVKRMLRVLLK